MSKALSKKELAEAGRRKLEEFKKKKQQAKSNKPDSGPQHIDELTTEKLELMRGLQQQARANEALAEENRSLGEQHNQMASRVAAEQAAVKRLEAEVEAVAASMAALVGERDAHRAAATEASERANALAAENVSLENQLLEAKSAQLRAQKEASAATSAAAKLEERASQLSAAAGKATAELSGLQAERRILKARLMQAEARMRSAGLAPLPPMPAGMGADEEAARPAALVDAEVQLEESWGAVLDDLEAAEERKQQLQQEAEELQEQLADMQRMYEQQQQLLQELRQQQQQQQSGQQQVLLDSSAVEDASSAAGSMVDSSLSGTVLGQQHWEDDSTASSKVAGGRSWFGMFGKSNSRQGRSALVAAVEYTSDFASLGPCDVAEQPLEPLVLPEESGCGSYCRLSPRLHLPVLHNSSASTATTPGSPVTTNDTRCSTSSLSTVVFFSGFQLRSAYYTPYARWLASWGFACVQYDLALLHIVPDEVELGYLPYLLDYLQHHPSTKCRLDLTRIGTAGHSRGGKLAALHLADNPHVVAAFLVDPVDSGGDSSSSSSSSLAAVGDTGRSAVQALAGRHKQAAIAGAGVSGPCNPQQRSYHAFFEVLAAGSWLEVVPAGGHMQFAKVTNSIIGHALDWLCHSGHTSHEHVIELAAPALVAWMEAQLRHQQPAAAAGVAAPYLPAQLVRPAAQLAQRHSMLALSGQQQDSRRVQGLQGFFKWVKKEQLAGEIIFEVKQDATQS
ncbi:hypothetical protein OEZ85_010951 [Tetradesmus obliquus]|uniref:Chlorophyllase n=1 Tax=Tetradesmus obliquus TaxID=3088 RepID=A0ABY8TP50_TETOB|nr:hypothetical protein OEZ85_010951 [Tetradesmus obliquus]